MGCLEGMNEVCVLAVETGRQAICNAKEGERCRECLACEEVLQVYRMSSVLAAQEDRVQDLIGVFVDDC